MSNEEYSFNRTKRISISVDSADKRINKFHDLCLDYVLQREPDQWPLLTKSNLVADMLQRYNIPNLTFAQKEINGGVLTIVIDGLQRLTTAQEYVNNKFKISTKVANPIIRYINKIEKKSNGEPDFDWQEFDIRGKYYKDLPDRLQADFLDYEFEACVYLNCTDEQIQYHIRRYNDGRAMNNNQKAILKVGYEYMRHIKEFCGSEFFNDGKYKASEEKKNTYERICVDSMMAAYFTEDWKKTPQDNAEYIASNAIPGDFDSFGELLNRVQKVVTDTNKVLFTPKDTHIWLTVFDKFTDLGEPDEKFGEFMDEFVRNLHAKKVNGVSFDDVTEVRRTRDKMIVCKKIEILYDLLTEFVGYNGADVIPDIRAITDGFSNLKVSKKDETPAVETKKENNNEGTDDNVGHISGDRDSDGSNSSNLLSDNNGQISKGDVVEDGHGDSSDDSDTDLFDDDNVSDIHDGTVWDKDGMDNGDTYPIAGSDRSNDFGEDPAHPDRLDRSGDEVVTDSTDDKYVDPFADGEEDLSISSPEDSSGFLNDDIDKLFDKPDSSGDLGEEDNYDDDDYDLPW